MSADRTPDAPSPPTPGDAAGGATATPGTRRPRHVPLSTYRLQIQPEYPLSEARSRVPYLDRLGVTDLYSSPLLVSTPGSSHGYDVVDPTRIDPEVGGEAELVALGRELDDRGMGLVLDLVPNHMAANLHNPWWRHVLAHGRASPYADFFDVRWDWERDGRLLLPILGDLYGRELEAGNLRLEIDPESGPALRYWERRLPLTPRSLRHVLAWRLEERRRDLGEDHPALAAFTDLLAALGCDADGKLLEGHPQPAEPGRPGAETTEEDRRSASAGAGPASALEVPERLAALWGGEAGSPSPRALLAEALDAINAAPPELDRVIAEQPYRPAVWRLATEAVNYRRFFDIADLVSLRQEDEGVFAATHRLPLRLVREGTVDGLRIDHVDGLRDPRGYLARLQRGAAVGEAEGPLWVVVEKILAADEDLPPSWAVAGTTGYDFQNSLTGLFVDPDGLRDLDRLYARFTGELARFEDVRYEHKHQAVEELFRGEMTALATELAELAAQDLSARDVPPSELTRALEEVTACLAVYRTYVDERAVAAGAAGLEAGDAEYLDRAVAEARARVREAGREGPLTAAAFDFLDRVLHLSPPPELAAERPRWYGFLARWQQLTGPAMAKGLEDTALYVYNRLLSLNAVGGEPEGVDPPGDAAAFHRRNGHRREHWPYGMTCTSTHDAKRSEDVRARLNVLSELARPWSERVERWTELNRPRKRSVRGRLVPDANEEIFLYQTLVGAWPLGDPGEERIRERLEAYLVKAAREAKVHTSWIEQDDEYEEALVAFTHSLLDPSGPNPFLDDLMGFVSLVAFFGAWSSLAQVVLKMVSPGVPDVYRGCELWDFSLVDPDNRRPVDWELRERYLGEMEERLAAAGEDSAAVGALVDELVGEWEDGRVKLWVTWRALQLRRAHRELFLEGDYLPLEVAGRHADSVVAFARRLPAEEVEGEGEQIAGGGPLWAVAVVPRWLSRVTDAGRPPVGERWEDTALLLPSGAPAAWHNALDGAALESERAGSGGPPVLPLHRLFAHLPVALLVGGG